MKKPSLKEKIQYHFDNLMSKGSVALVGMLFFVSALVAVLVGIILELINHEHSLGFNIWTSVMHILDAGTLSAADTADIGYIVLMSIATICGLFVTSILIGIITTGFEEKLNSLKKGNSRVIESNHTVILGFNHNIYTLISELILANENQKDGCIVILASEDKETIEGHIAENIHDFKTTRIICRTGSISDINSLKNCSLETCRSIIINSEEDFLTIKTILSVNNYLKNNCEGKLPHIVSTVNKMENYEASKIISEDNLEMILVENSISRIIAQTCRQPGLSNVLIELFDYDGDELYFEKFPELIGETFGSVINRFEKAVVFGIKRGEEIFLNPEMDTEIIDGDELILLVEDDGMARTIPEEKRDVSELLNDDMLSLNKLDSVLIIGSGKLMELVVLVLDTFYNYGSSVYLANSDREYDYDKLKSKLENINLETYICDTSRRENLEELLNLEPKNILLLSDDGLDDETSDAMTLMKLIHLRDIAKKNDMNFSITSELKRVENQKLAQMTQANDLVVGSNIINLLLTQISENRQLAKVFEELLKSDGAEIHIKNATDYVRTGVEMDFYEVSEVMKNYNSVAIGYKIEDGDHFEIVTNPKKSDKIIFSEMDSIILLAND